MFSVDLEVRTLESQRRSLASLFLSTGRTSTMDLEERVARPCLARLRSASGLLQEGAQMDYFPDPPCILPCPPRPDCDDEGDTAAGMGESAPHSYWKQHATWLENWPSLDRSRAATREFVARWDDDSGASNPQAFVNVCEQPVAVRSQPVDSSDAKTEVWVQPGEMVVVAEVVERQGTRYLRLASGAGWLFETQGRAPVMARMACVAVGSWWFRVACGEALEVHTAPTFAASPSGWVMSPTEIFLVDVKTRVRGCKFFHLADGRGWIPELRQPAHPRGSACSPMWPHADAPTLLVKEAEADLEGRSVGWFNYSSIVPSTSDVVEVGEWRYVVGELPVLAIGSRQFGELLEPGESVKVDKRAFASGDAPGRGQPGTASSRWCGRRTSAAWWSSCGQPRCIARRPSGRPGKDDVGLLTVAASVTCRHGLHQPCRQSA